MPQFSCMGIAGPHRDDYPCNGNPCLPPISILYNLRTEWAGRGWVRPEFQQINPTKNVMDYPWLFDQGVFKQWHFCCAIFSWHTESMVVLTSWSVNSEAKLCPKFFWIFWSTKLTRMSACELHKSFCSMFCHTPYHMPQNIRGVYTYTPEI